jgi:hypothetical protein
MVTSDQQVARENENDGDGVEISHRNDHCGTDICRNYIVLRDYL